MSAKNLSQNLGSLIEHHRSEMKNYVVRAAQCDDPTVAAWHAEMATMHETWANAIEQLLRESSQGEHQP